MLTDLFQALLHEFAAFRPVEMRVISAGWLHKLANLRETLRCKPAVPVPSLDCDAIRFYLVEADSLMRTFMTEYPELNWRGQTRKEPRIEDDQPRIGASEINVVGVEHRRSASTIHAPAIDLQHPCRDRSTTVRGNIGFGTQMRVWGIQRLGGARIARRHDRHKGDPANVSCRPHLTRQINPQ